MDVRDTDAEHGWQADGRRGQAIAEFGQVVGEALDGYRSGSFGIAGGLHTRAFAEVLVTVFETGTHEDRVNAVAAALGALEARDIFVRNEAVANTLDACISLRSPF